MDFWWGFQEFIMFGFEHLVAKLGPLISVFYYQPYELYLQCFLYDCVSV